MILARFQTHTAIAILIVFQSIGLSIQLSKCQYSYPRGIGDSSGTLINKVFDIDAVGNIASILTGTSSAFTSSIAYTLHDQYGNIKWLKYHSLGSYTVKTVKFQKSSTGQASTKMAILLDSTNLSFLILDMSGNILYSFKESSSYSHSTWKYQNQIYYDASGSIVGTFYYTSPSNSFQIIKFTPTTGTFSVDAGFIAKSSVGASSSYGYATTKGTETNEYYFTSQYIFSNYSSFEQIHRISFATNAEVATYRLQRNYPSLSSNGDFGALDVVISATGIQTVVGCGSAEYGSTYTNFRTQQYMISFNLATNAITQQLNYDQTGYLRQCYDAKFKSTTEFYTAMVEMDLQYDSYIYRTYNIGATSASQTITQLTFFRLYWVYRVQILSDFSALFAGSYYPCAVGTSCKDVVFLTSSNSANACSTYQQASTDTSTTISSFNSNLFYVVGSTVQSQSFSFATLSITLTALSATQINTILPNRAQTGCTAPTLTFTTISGTSTYSVAAHIKQNGNFNYNMDQLFSGDSICSDKVRTYSITNQPGNVNTYSISSSTYLYASQASLAASTTDQVVVNVVFVTGVTSSITLTITIRDCSSNQVTLPTPFSSATYYINATAATVSVATYNVQKSYCTAPTQSMTVSPAISPTTAITYDGTLKQVSVSSNTYLSKGTYTVTITFTNPMNTANTYSFTFTVTIKCTPTIIATSSTTPVFFYNVGSGTSSYDFSSSLSYSNNCGNTFSYKVLLSGSSSAPIFVTSTVTATKSFQVQTADDYLKGTYSLTVVAILNDELNTKNSQLQMVIQILGEVSQESSQFNMDTFIEYPQLSQKLNQISIEAEQTYLYALPRIIFSNIHQVQVVYTLDKMKWFTVQKSQYSLEFKPNKNQTGLYKVKIKLQDKKDDSIYSIYYQYFLVYYKRKQNYTEDQIFQMKLDKFQSLDYYKNLTDIQKKTFEDFQAQIESISIFGDLIIRVNQDLTFDSEKKRFKDAMLKVYLQPYLELGQELTDWQITSFTEREIRLKLAFNNTNLVSSYNVQDRIRVQIVRNVVESDQRRNLIVSTTDLKQRNYQFISAPLPNQVDTKQQSSSFAFGILFEIVLYILLFETMILGFLVQEPLQFNNLPSKRNIYTAWSAFLSLQMMATLPIINKEYPSIVLYFNSFLLHPLNFDLRRIIPSIGSFFVLGRNYIQNSQENADISIHLSFLGYDSSYSLAVLQSFSILMCLGFFLLAFMKIVLMITDTFKSSCLKIKRTIKGFVIGSIFQQIYSQLRYNYFLRLFLQFYLQISVSVFIVLFDYSSNLSSQSQKRMINTVSSVLLMIVIIAFPIILMYKIFQNLKQPKNQQTFIFHPEGQRTMRDQYGTVYENYFTDSKSYFLFFSMFYIRRLAYGFFLPWIPFQLQVGIQISLTYIIIWIVTQNRPYLNDLEHKLSLFNEICYLACLILTLIVSQIQLSYLIKFYFGCLYMAVISLVLVINFVLINMRYIDDVRLFVRHYRQRLETVKLSQTQEILLQTDKLVVEDFEEKVPKKTINRNYKKQLFAAQYGDTDENEETEQKLKESQLSFKASSLNFKPTRLFLTQRVANQILEKSLKDQPQDDKSQGPGKRRFKI